MIRKTEGIVLKAFDFRETSRIATFFTKDYGKVKGIFKGIRTDPKKYGSNLDKFSINDIVYYWHADADLHLVGQCDLKEFFFPIRQNITRSMSAQYALELVDAIMPPEEENGDVYRLLADFLTAMQDVREIDKLVYVFQLKILHISGFRPHLDNCLICQKNFTDNAKFSKKLGGIICSACQSNDTSATPISKGTIASLLYIERHDWAANLKFGLSPYAKRELKETLNNFLTFHLDKQLKSARYLA